MEQPASNYSIRLFSGRLFAIFLSVFLIFFSDSIKADIGLDWLSSQATAEGNYASNGDVATTFQATAETIHTLHTLDAIAQANLQNSLLYLKADTVRNTENLSRAMLINTLAGSETTSLMTDLSKHGNSDGGFGDFAGHESTTVDTAFALEALAVSGGSVPQAAGNAVAYLASKQNPDGGFSLSGSNESNVYVTSLCLRALQNYIFQYNVSGVISSASQYLLSKQSITGGWDTDWETAIALLAVAPITSDTTRYADAVLALEKGQNTDGSWGGSVYTTALALRALHNIKNLKPPVDVTKGMFTGRVVEETTNTPLAKVSVSINDAANTTVLTGEDGTFAITNVSPNNYTLSYAIDGYSTVRQNAGVSAGQRVDLGTIRLPRLPDTGILSGIISDAVTGLPISGAVITTSGALTATITTLADGSFKLTSPPGDVTVSVNADGYRSIMAVGVIVAGSTLNFSPALYASDSPPLSEPLTIFGSVKDSITGLPVAGAVVALQNTSVAAASDSDGRFVLAEVEPGNLMLLVSAMGYIPYQNSILAVAGNNLDIGGVYLNRESAQKTSTVKGAVRDSVTGLPVSGASVVVEGTGMIATTDSQGKYEISAIEPLNFSLLASIPGYVSQFTAISLVEPVTTQIDFALEPFSQNGIVIDSISSDRTDYPAYSPVLISAAVRNSGTEALKVKLLLEVMDDQGEVIQQLQTSDLSAIAGSGNSTVILPDATLESTSEWNTDIKKPGMYQISLKVFDEYSNRLLAERLADFTILATKKLEEMTLSAIPKFTYVGAEQQIELVAAIVNRSNVEQAVTLEYQWLAPDGKILESGASNYVLSSSDVVKALEIASFPYTFTNSGDYPFNVQLSAGDGAKTEKSGLISVAPSVRLEVDQGINPDAVVPDGDKRITINIRLKGVEQK